MRLMSELIIKLIVGSTMVSEPAVRSNRDGKQLDG